MSQKRKQQRAHHKEEEARKAGRVVKWIFAVLILLALCYGIFISVLMAQ